MDVVERLSVTVDIEDIVGDTEESTEGTKEVVSEVEADVDTSKLLLVPKEDVAEVLPLADCDTDWDEVEKLPVTKIDEAGEPFDELEDLTLVP